MATELTASIIDGVFSVSGSATRDQRRSIEVEIFPPNQFVVREDTGDEFVEVPVSSDGSSPTSATFEGVDDAGVEFLSSRQATVFESIVGTSFNDVFDLRDNVVALLAKGGGGNDRILIFGEGESRLLGQRGNDFLTISTDSSCVLSGGAGNDRLEARSGDDRFKGGGQNDTIEGGAGVDIAVYSGAREDYLIEVSGDTYTITDLRAGSPDGRDTVSEVEVLRFSDGRVDIEDTVAGSGMASASVAEFWI